jgi:hypothetical protein
MSFFDGLLASWNNLVQNLWKALGFEGKEGTLLLLGLDNAGKCLNLMDQLQYSMYRLNVFLIRSYRENNVTPSTANRRCSVVSAH